MTTEGKPWTLKETRTVTLAVLKEARLDPMSTYMILHGLLKLFEIEVELRYIQQARKEEKQP